MLLYILKLPGQPATLFPKKNHSAQDENRVKAEKSCCRGDDDENDEKGDGDYFYDYVSSPFFIYVNKHRIDLKILLRLLMYFELDLILN